MKLISCTDFVLKQKDELKLRANLHYYVEAFDLAWKMINYANFLKQTLTLSMFVPTDDEGYVLSNPKDSTLQYQKIIDEYQQAKERVIFEGFEGRYSESGYQVSNENILIVFYDAGYIVTYKDCFDYKTNTIENLIQFNLTITPNAVKKYQL